MSKISLKHSGGNVVSLNSPTSAPTSADVAFKLPNADGSAGQFMKTDGSGNLSFDAVSAGITMADQWRLTTTFQTTSAAFITSNWERVDTYGYGKIGTGMSESSGVFSFPSTGIYLVRSVVNWYSVGGGVNYARISIQVTTDNSNYNAAANSHSGVNNDGQYNNMTAELMLDVTDVSTHKVKFQTFASNTNPRILGDSGQNRTYVTFIRLGDT